MKKLLLLISIFAVLNLSFTVNKCIAQWTPTNYPSDVGAYSIIKYGSNFFAGTYGYGVYKSSDNGMNWAPSGLNYQIVWTLAASGPYILAGTELSGIYVSSDNGTTWVQSNLTDRSINCLFVNGTYIFTGTDASGIYRSTDYGFNWSPTALITTSVYSLAAKDSYLFAGGNARVRRSSDNGASYTIFLVSSGIIPTLAVCDMYVYAGSAFGLYASTNNGANWTQTSLNNRQIQSIVTCGTNILAGTTQYGVYLSTDYGINWVQKNEGLTVMPYVTMIYEAGDYLFISTDYYTNPVWRRLKSDIIPSSAPALLSPENNSVIDTRIPVLTWGSITGTAYYNLKVSTDAAFSSTIIDLNNITDTLYNVPAGILQDSGTYFWKVSAGSGEWSDAWQFSTLIPITPEYTIEKVTLLTDNIYDLLSGEVISPENAEMLISKLNNAIIQINLSHYKIAVNRIEQFIFEVNLLKWKNILTEVQANPLLANANEIIYMLNILNFGDNPKNNPVPVKQFSLKQNYPNPFNPSTNIKLEIPRNSLVKLAVFDVLGREVAVLINEELKPGEYEVEWDASNFSSGVYYYRLEAGEFIEARKMIIIK